MQRSKPKTRSVKRTTSSVRRAASKVAPTPSSLSTLSFSPARSMPTRSTSSSSISTRNAVRTSSKSTAASVQSKRAITTNLSSSASPLGFNTISAPAPTFTRPTQVSAPTMTIKAPSASIHTSSRPSLTSSPAIFMKKTTTTGITKMEAPTHLPARNMGIFTPNAYYNLHTNHMKNWLTARGLYIEDMYYHNALCKLAVNELPADVRNDRLRRIKRAVDLDIKMKELPKELQDYDPFVSYGLDDAISRIEATVAERFNYI